MSSRSQSIVFDSGGGGGGGGGGGVVWGGPGTSRNREESQTSHKVYFGPANGPKFKLGKKFGSGTFGELRLGKNQETHEFVAVKLESYSVRYPQLETEWNNYQILGADLGIPVAYYFGPVEFPDKTMYNALVMELLDLNLENVFDIRKRKFSLKTVLMIIIQTLQRMEYVHSRGLLYRDVKPQNFVVGRDGTPSEGVIFMIDFGMAKPYMDPMTSKHIPFQEKIPPSGTLRYMSVNSHHWREMSRRDDLESLGYIYVYFMRGQLPWSGVKATNENERFIKVGNLKDSTSLEKLCKGMPDEFANYLKTVKELNFAESPNYEKLRKPFKDLMEKRGFKNDKMFDWKGKLPNEKLSSKNSEKFKKISAT